MPRPKLAVPKVRLMLHLPLDLRTQLDLSLYSELEKRVPDGAYTGFFADRLREHFSWQTLELKPFGFPEGYFVRGPKDMIEILQKRLALAQPNYAAGFERLL